MKDRIAKSTYCAPTEHEVRRYLPDVTEEEAGRQGYWAYCFGMGISDCPYRQSTKAYDAWVTQYQEAEAGNEG